MCIRDRFWDVFALRTAMSVSGNYSFVITRAMKLAFLGLLAINLLAWACLLYTSRCV